MAIAEQGTYAFIPPPPLPEFYLQKKEKKQHDTSTSSSSTIEVDARTIFVKEEPAMVDGVYDGRPRAATIHRAPGVPLMAMPPHPVYANEVPPLAIYHICRVCLRPRSPRYHREHPIPINGLPPPPGICRRCRVTTVEETKKVADIVEVGESNKIKLGCIAPFIPDEDIISNKEMRNIRMKKYLRTLQVEHDSSNSEDSPRKDNTYRHVKVVNEYEDPPQPRKTKVTFTKSTTRDRQEEPIALQPPAKSQKDVKTKELRKSDSTKASVSNKATSSSSSTSSTKTPAQAVDLANTAQPQRTDSEVRNIAREEIERYRDAYWKSERSDNNIRKIAREEVEHYRRAERKLEAHPDPYAHGRMVPVGRRIEQERDVPEPLPWEQTVKNQEVSVSAEVPQKRTEVKIQATSNQSESQSSKKQSTSSTSSSTSGSTSMTDDKARTSHVKKSVAQAPRQGYDEATRSTHVLKHEAREGSKPTASNSKKSSTMARDTATPTSVKSPAVVGSISHPKVPRYTVVYRSAHEGEEFKPRPDESGSKVPKRAVKASATTQWNCERISGGPSDDQESAMPPQDAETDRERRLIREKEHTPSQPSLSWKQRTWSKSSKPSQRDSWYHESSVRTLDEPCSSYWETSGSGVPSQATQWQSNKGTEASQTSIKSQIKPEEGPVYTYKPSDRPRVPTKPRQELPYPEHDLTPDGMVRPSDVVTEPSSKSRPPRSSRSVKDDETEYLYAERIVQPAHRPLGRRPFDEHAPARHVEVEEIVETRRTPVKWKQGHYPDKGHSPVARYRREKPDHIDNKVVETWKTPSGESATQRSYRNRRRADSPLTPFTDQPPQFDHRTSYEMKDHMVSERSTKRPPHIKPSEMELSFAASSKVDEKDSSWRHEKGELRAQATHPAREISPNSRRQPPSNSKQDPRVQFSSKVHISPTPPGSDASSSEIRKFHRVERKKTAQVDGNLSPDRLKDHVEAYAESGRMRPFDAGSRYSQYEERESVHERGRSHWERSPGREYDTHERRRARRLQRALSESPSREESLSAVRQDKIEAEKEEFQSRNDKARPGAEKGRQRTKKVEATTEKSDGKGPYREEKITDSMRVENGSTGSRVWADREERRWRDV